MTTPPVVRVYRFIAKVVPNVVPLTTGATRNLGIRHVERRAGFEPAITCLEGRGPSRWTNDACSPPPSVRCYRPRFDFFEPPPVLHFAMADASVGTQEGLFGGSRHGAAHETRTRSPLLGKQVRRQLRQCCTRVGGNAFRQSRVPTSHVLVPVGTLRGSKP